jgi:Fe-S-cluster-containing hydrogenase component 2
MAACIQKNANRADSAAAALRVDLEPFSGAHSLIYCRQCIQPACVGACLQKAIDLNFETGAYEIRRDICIRCGTCVSACPFQAISFSETIGPVKCDLCAGNPKCEIACHFGVLSIERN